MLINNPDVAGLCRRVERFYLEMLASASTGNEDMGTFDKGRDLDYLNALEAYVAWAVKQNELDVPKTGGASKYEAGSTPEAASLADVQSEDAKDILSMWALAHGEMVGSTSAIRPNGINKHDEKRVLSYIARHRAFYAEYVDVTDPLDLPTTTKPASS